MGPVRCACRCWAAGHYLPRGPAFKVTRALRRLHVCPCYSSFGRFEPSAARPQAAPASKSSPVPAPPLAPTLAKCAVEPSAFVPRTPDGPMSTPSGCVCVHLACARRGGWFSGSESMLCAQRGAPNCGKRGRYRDRGGTACKGRGRARQGQHRVWLSGGVLVSFGCHNVVHSSRSWFAAVRGGRSVHAGVKLQE
jgi:hypothetical protein